ncbi:MAG: polysaccharide deacetylase family protein [Dysgonamonadaceae bacterium]|nr:polysaccharide deacetylase family protein [Dysgonamonadaceae bacterium]
MYHHIGKEDDGNPSDYFVSDEMFAKHLDFLLAENYNPVSLSDVESAYFKKTKLPERAVLLTFDDGYSNNYEYAFPLALSRKIPITIFVNAGEINMKDGMLDWSQVQEMANSGFVRFASHGMSHRNLRQMDYSEAISELLLSRTWLHHLSQSDVRSFCYPYGAFDKQVREWVFEAGFRLDFGTRKGINAWPWTGRRPLKRLHIMRGDSLEDFSNQLRRGKK